MASGQEPTGVYVRGMYLQEQLGNLGEPTPPCVNTPENEGQTGRPKGLASAGKTSHPPTSRKRNTNLGSNKVPGSDSESEANWEGLLAVLADHSTDGSGRKSRIGKAGNRSPRDPLQGRGSRA